MNYYFSKTLNMSFDMAIAGVTEELKKEGFGILTDIDVKATLKKKLDVEFRTKTKRGLPLKLSSFTTQNDKSSSLSTENILFPCDSIYTILPSDPM